MIINIYFDIVTKNAGEVAQLTACGVLLMLTNKDDVRCRLLGFGLGGSNTDLAKIQAARLALASIDSRYRKTRIIIHLADETVLNYLKDAKEHTKEVDELVRWCEFYDDLGFTLSSSNNGNIMICCSLARTICLSQKSYDSLTLDHIPDEQD